VEAQTAINSGFSAYYIREVAEMRHKMLDIKYSPSRLYAHATVVLFMALVRPDSTPALWQSALVAVLLDEALYRLYKQIRRELNIKPGKYRLVKHWWEELENERNAQEKA
jgi:hypothetical protein